LSHIPHYADPNLLVGTETHDDAGVYRLTPDIALVQTLDFFPPVVDDPYVYGQIAATNSLSDVYAMGGVPLTALNLVGFPDDKLDMSILGKILAGGAERCRAAKCTIVGGHTVRDGEIKFGLSVTGTIHPDKILTNANCKPGDVLVLTKPLGTGFVTTASKRKQCPESLLQAACNSMTTLNDTGRDAMVAAGAHAATDITGFGLAGHLFEMAEGSKTTIILDLNKIPLLPGLEQLDVTKHRTRASATNLTYTIAGTQFDGTVKELNREVFYDAQTSGGLLICIAADRLPKLLEELKKANTLAMAVIGEVVSRREKALWVKGS
jgi:selenide, water dikinase